MRAARALMAAIPAIPAAIALAWLGMPAESYYRILDSRSRIEVIVQTGGLVSHSRGLVLRAHDVNGRILLDPLRRSQASIELRLPVRGLEPVSPRMTRAEAAEVMTWLRSSWVLDMPRWAEISFVGSGVRWGEPRGSGFLGVRCPGNLEIHGRRERVLLQGIARVTSEGVEVRGRHFVRQRDHGMIPLRDLSGVYTIQNAVEVAFQILAVPETSLELEKGEARPPRLTERAGKSGTLESRGEPPAVTAPEPRIEGPSGDFTDPKWEPR